MITIKEMTVLYDANCQFCIRCRNWLDAQLQRIPLRFIPINSQLMTEMYPTLATAELNELVVITDKGAVYYKESAFLMCLYALSEFYEWSFKFSGPTFKPLIRNAYHYISNNRLGLMGKPDQSSDDYLHSVLKQNRPEDSCHI